MPGGPRQQRQETCGFRMYWLLSLRVPLVWSLTLALLGLWALHQPALSPTSASCASFVVTPSSSASAPPPLHSPSPCPELPSPSKCPVVPSPSGCPAVPSASRCPVAPSPSECPSCKAAAQLPAGGGKISVLASQGSPEFSSIADVRNALTVNGVIQAVAITSGNAAMNRMIRNWAASISKASGDPLPYFAIPLDAEGYAGLKSAGGVNIFKDVRAHSAFTAGGSNYGDPVYGDLSAYKWRFASELLAIDVPVLLSDPDVVILRNPVPYINTLPKCDIYMQMDVDFPSTGQSIRDKNGWFYVNQRDFFCGGFAMLTTSPASKAQLELFLGEIGRMRREDSKLEEQTVWNRMMTNNFTRVTTENVVDAIMARRCITYQHTGSGAKVDIWPLNPNLFPNHPIMFKEKMPEHVLEPPFIIHYNWLYGITAKVNTMHSTGNWFLGDF